MFTEFRRYSRGIMDMRLRLYFEELGQIMVPYPSAADQHAVVSFIENVSDQLDALLIEAGKTIDLLQERRSALISAAVTGKIDVRNYTPKEAA